MRWRLNGLTRRTKIIGAVLLLASFAVSAEMLAENSDFAAPGRVEGAGPAMSIGVAATEGIDGIVSRLQPHVMFADPPESGSKGPAEVGERLILASGLGG